jgi:hypothetical protein
VSRSGTIRTNGFGALNGVIEPTVAAFFDVCWWQLRRIHRYKPGSYGRRLPQPTKTIASMQASFGADLFARLPLAYGVEVTSDGSFDLAGTSLTGGLATGEGQWYGGRAGAMMEYGRLTFGASAGLEAFYDGTTRIETQSIYDVGVSNKSGRYTYGVAGQHRRSHDENITTSSVTTDMVIGISAGVDLEVGYQYSRVDAEAVEEPVHTHEGKADIRLSF